MGNLTSASITIHHCPPDRVRAVLDSIEDVQGFGSDPEDRKSLELGIPYEIESFPINDCADVAQTLIAVAPDAVFTVIEEPAYTGLGTVALHVPRLGLYLEDCNVCGAPLFSHCEVIAMAEDEPAARADKLGVPWLRAINALSAEPDPVEPEPFLATWDRTTGDILVRDGNAGGDLQLTGELVPDDARTADGPLAEHGFNRITPWLEPDATPTLWRTYLYRQPVSPHDA